MNNLLNVLLIFILSLCTYTPAHAANYYFSSKGNDRNEGTNRKNPWQSLQRFASLKSNLKSGDSIFFERGSQFKGALSLSGSGVYVGAYGTGPMPVISGSEELGEWKLFKKNIWKATCSNCPSAPANLFIDGKAQQLGRYPNQGYLPISAYREQGVSFIDDRSSFPEGYWNNAEVVVRSSRWTLDRLSVSKYKERTFYFLIAPSYPLENDFGYFIQNHLSTLDQEGEWFFDPASLEMFLYSEKGLPRDGAITVSVRDFGIRVTDASNVILENIHFTQQQLAGVRFENCKSPKIKNIKIAHSGKNGMEIVSCIRPSVINSSISHSNNNGVDWLNNIDGLFQNNSITAIATRAGAGVGGNGTYIALSITSYIGQAGGNIIANNRIDSVGYIGIDFRSRNTTIKNNFISNFCLMKDDGAGIYTWGNSLASCTITGNTIVNGIGSGDGSLRPQDVYVSGIYIDDKSSHLVIENNNVSNCAMAGLYIHNSKNIKVAGNVLSNNGTSIANKEKGQLFIKFDAINKIIDATDHHLEVTNNKLIARNEVTSCIFFSTDTKFDFNQVGIFSKNQFQSTQAKHAVVMLSAQQGICHAPEEFTLEAWKEKTKNEKGSTFLQLKSDNSVSKTNIIVNGGMANDLENWIAWPASTSITTDKKNQSTGTALKMDISSGSEAMLYQQGIFLRSDKVYCLRFSCWSVKAGQIEFVPLMAHSPWEAVGEYTCFSIDSSLQTFSYYFKPVKNIEARVNFKSNQSFWITNVSLTEAMVKTSGL